MFDHLAATPKTSKGRLFKENDSDHNRSPYERDRSRVIHSSSFRKLKYKTQVFIESESDYFRTRLTHSLEVSQISRSICRLLKLNEDLGETVALAHDLGHPPFGHNGEKALNIAMQNHGGFNHNDQTLRVLTHIEKRHPDYNGLNLTWESLEGIVKHNGIILNNIPFHTNVYNRKHDLLLNNQPLLESQIAAISDDVAYNNHDVEDAIRAGLLSIDQLKENVFFKNIIIQLKKEYKIIDDKLLMFQVLRKSMSIMIEDIYQQTNQNILNLNIMSKEEFQNYSNFIVTFSPLMISKSKDIKSFLFENVYNHQNLLDKRKNVEKIISNLFKYFYNSPNKLPNDWRNINEPIERIICDYISGMTDRYASRLHKDLHE
jgi:dGTPase